jgi:hypothetical protein
VVARKFQLPLLMFSALRFCLNIISDDLSTVTHMSKESIEIHTSEGTPTSEYTV